MSVSKGEYFETLPGQLSRYRHRERTRRLYVAIDQEPKSKNAMGKAERIAFQKKVLGALDRAKRLAFKGPVVAIVSACSTLKNPPHIHTIAKCLLDLFGAPLSESGITRKGLVYYDDSQVKGLSVSYLVGHQKPSILVEFAPLQAFAEDLSLACRIEAGEFEGLPGEHDWDAKLHDLDSDPRRHRRDLQQMIDHPEVWIDQFGQEAYSSLLDFRRMNLQESWSEGARLSPHDLLYLLKEAGVAPLSPSLAKLESKLAASVGRLIRESPVRIRLPSVPTKEGEGKLFREGIKGALDQYLGKFPFMKDLRIPAAVEVVYVPPPDAAHGFSKDLDNIIRSILPTIHEVLRPPAIGAPPPPGLTHSVARFDIYEIPRQLGSTDGDLVVGVTPVLSTFGGVMHRVYRIIERCRDRLID